MSDKKNSPSSDLEANLAKIANTKPRKRMRKDNIYERFITRVESVDSADDAEFKENEAEIESGLNNQTTLKPLRNVNKLSSYEPLSAAELELFDTQTQENLDLHTTENISSGINLDFSDEDEGLSTNRAAIANTDEPLTSDSVPAYIADSTDTDNLTSQHSTQSVSEYTKNQQPDNNDFINDKELNKQSVKSKARQANSKKSLVIGMVFGSLLIAAVVATLIFTGVLSTSSSTDVPNNADKVTTANNKPVASTEPAVVEEGVLEESAQTSTNPSTTDMPTAQSVPNDSANQNQGTVGGSESAQPTSNDADADSSITYEDFRQESQSTLYRETND